MYWAASFIIREPWAEILQPQVHHSRATVRVHAFIKWLQLVALLQSHSMAKDSSRCKLGDSFKSRDIPLVQAWKVTLISMDDLDVGSNLESLESSNVSTKPRDFLLTSSNVWNSINSPCILTIWGSGKLSHIAKLTDKQTIFVIVEKLTSPGRVVAGIHRKNLLPYGVNVSALCGHTGKISRGKVAITIGPRYILLRHRGPCKRSPSWQNATQMISWGASRYIVVYILIEDCRDPSTRRIGRKSGVPWLSMRVIYRNGLSID
jgi:hypothetical protein